MQFKKLQLKVKVEVGFKFEITFFNQYLGLSIFYQNLCSNNPALFRVYIYIEQYIIYCEKLLILTFSVLSYIPFYNLLP